ncbi:hypothetical protein [Actinomadura harenae]|uniref:Uncharacterized protein n=1 Tax=Actinomadura harenae TaxID=2483351 RepID=A0A3M2LPH6_9ACTN|nr:hypothetical protein [Actinomadura harenae]RMI37995.1 hypothetical protein EBO15_34160 [Actinomadura harenae]
MSEIPSAEESTGPLPDQDGPSPTSAPVQPTTRRRPRAAIALLLAFGLLAVAGGGAAIVYQLVRKPTAAEIDKAGARELATRWQRLRVADLFPERFLFDKKDEPSGTLAQLRRVGIAPSRACADAVDTPTAAILAKHGCTTVLRATYLDPSGTRAVSVGVAVFPDTSSSDDAATDLTGLNGGKKSGSGLRVATFPGTTVERFDDGSRQVVDAKTNHTPYLFLRAEGPLHPQGRIEQGELVSLWFAPDLLDRIMARFADDSTPCARKDVRC